MKRVALLFMLVFLAGCSSNSRDSEYEKRVAEWRIKQEAERVDSDRRAAKMAKEKEERLKACSQSAPYFGTTVPFVETYVEACKKAGEENKLVFVLHLSGDFKNNDFT